MRGESANKAGCIARRDGESTSMNAQMVILKGGLRAAGHRPVALESLECGSAS